MLADPGDDSSFESTEHDAKALERQVAAMAQGFRASFGRNRRDYNFAVCDALAGAGLTPTASAVLRVGRWGQNASVASDVRQWNQALAGRLQRIESSIPLAAKRQAGELFEQLFALATRSAQAQADERLVPLREELAQARAALAAAQQAEQSLQTRLTALEAASEVQAQALANEQAERLAQAQAAQAAIDAADAAHRALARKAEALAQQLQAAEQALQDSARQQAQAQATARQELLGAREATARELLAAQQGFDAERRRLMLALDHDRVEHARQLKALQLELQAAQARLDAVRADAAQVAVAHAGAKASLDGAQALLAAERLRFAQREEHLQSPAYRHQSLVDFVEQAGASGVHITREADAQALRAWLQASLGLEPVRAGKLVGAMALRPPLPAADAPASAQAPGAASA